MESVPEMPGVLEEDLYRHTWVRLSMLWSEMVRQTDFLDSF